jgi:hypothetical protein
MEDFIREPNLKGVLVRLDARIARPYIARVKSDDMVLARTPVIDGVNAERRVLPWSFNQVSTIVSSP